MANGVNVLILGLLGGAAIVCIFLIGGCVLPSAQPWSSTKDGQPRVLGTVNIRYVDKDGKPVDLPKVPGAASRRVDPKAETVNVSIESLKMAEVLRGN